MYLKLLYFLSACLIFNTCYAQTPAIPKKDSGDYQTCTVSGIVIRSQDSAPLKNATVQLANDSDQEHQIATKTTADGHFLLKNVPAGQYKLKVTRNGYADQELGQKKPGDPGATFTLRPGQSFADLVFKLGRAGVITGKVFDDDGEPMAGVAVRAMRQVWTDGRRSFATANEQQTNDLGEFRIFGLLPGRYYISAEMPTWSRIVGDREFSGSEKGSGERGYAKVFYPSAPDAASASSIYVKEGEEISSADIFMREVTVYRVRGKIQYLFPHRGTGDTQLAVMHRGQTTDQILFSVQAVVKADSSFEIPELAPGEYTVTAFFFDQGKFYSTQEDVDVVNADVDHLSLVIAPGVNIPGQLLWDGKPSLESERATIYLAPEESGFIVRGGEAHVEENNQFILKEVPQGTFRITVDGLSKDSYIKEVQFGETILPDHILHAKRGLTGRLDITISTKGARLEGIVANDESLPVAGVWVVAVPEESKRSLRYLYKSVTTDQYGHYDLRGLVPGKYMILAWDDVALGEWEDPDFFKKNGAKGVTVEMSDGDKKSADLQLIQRESKTSQAE
jgi:protocatechuate 3,4-dioxygenase beta subunit